LISSILHKSKFNKKYEKFEYNSYSEGTK